MCTGVRIPGSAKSARIGKKVVLKPAVSETRVSQKGCLQDTISGRHNKSFVSGNTKRDLEVLSMGDGMHLGQIVSSKSLKWSLTSRSQPDYRRTILCQKCINKLIPERWFTNPSVYGFAYTSTYSIYIRNLTQFVPYLLQILRLEVCRPHLKV